MTRDPEAESIANAEVFYAMRCFDPSRGVPWERWIARHVKRGIWTYWRKLKVRVKVTNTMPVEPETGECIDVAEPEYSEPDYGISLKLLTERYIEKWPLDVIARRYGWTVRQAQDIIAGATLRLLEKVACDE